MFIVLTGNPIDGLTCYGPFTTSEEANEWADLYLRHEDWWCATLHPWMQAKEGD